MTRKLCFASNCPKHFHLKHEWYLACLLNLTLLNYKYVATSNIWLTFTSQQSCKLPLVMIILYPRSEGRRLKSPPTMTKSHDPEVYFINWLISNAWATRWARYSSDAMSYSACNWKIHLCIWDNWMNHHSSKNHYNYLCLCIITFISESVAQKYKHVKFCTT